ncbi:hypothetical protein [Pyrobaculum calidifontis]|uniref:hypothetical protein n=1 Tax=Pyrobaculum calidifontis TaxID=181486 RepID=UPI00186BA15E|nr:hypothetical protein [Pyrobaculum calidifontis]
MCVSAEALAKVDGVLGPVFGPRRFGAFGGVFEVVGCRLRCVEGGCGEAVGAVAEGLGGRAVGGSVVLGGEVCAGLVYRLGLASSLRLSVGDASWRRSWTWGVGGLGRGFGFTGGGGPSSLS